jgi:hypothetical protein
VTSRTRADFHAHLDVCEQCANHPFELCKVGAELLELAAAGRFDLVEASRSLSPEVAAELLAALELAAAGRFDLVEASLSPEVAAELLAALERDGKK